MHTLIDIPDWQIKDLTAICKARHISRAEVIRQAISYYLESKNPKPPMFSAFGKTAKQTGLLLRNRSARNGRRLVRHQHFRIWLELIFLTKTCQVLKTWQV